MEIEFKAINGERVTVLVESIIGVREKTLDKRTDDGTTLRVPGAQVLTLGGYPDIVVAESYEVVSAKIQRVRGDMARRAVLAAGLR